MQEHLLGNPLLEIFYGCCMFFSNRRKERNFLSLTVDLCLPHSVPNSPQTRDGEEDLGVVRMGPPHHQDPNETAVNHKAQGHEGRATDEFHEGSKQEGADRVDDTETDHDIADGGHAQSTGDVSL